MFVEWLFLKKVVLSTALRKSIDLIPLLRAEDPQIIKQKYNQDIISKIKAKYPDPPANESEDRTKFSHIKHTKLEDHARWYEYRAQLLWGRQTQRARFRSAWFYVTAAQLYELAKHHDRASTLYHFAANSFRELEAFRASIDYYLKSSELASGAWVLRSLQRALGVALMAGDEDMETEIRKRLTEWKLPHSRTS